MMYLRSFNGRRVNLAAMLFLTILNSSCAKISSNDTLPTCLVSPSGLVDWWAADRTTSSSSISALSISNDASLTFTNKLSVGAWVKTSYPHLIPGQSIISKGHRTNGLSSYTSIAGNTVGLVGLSGGPGSDGRYIYFPPCGAGAA